MPKKQHPARAKFEATLKAVAEETGLDDLTGLHPVGAEWPAMGSSWATFPFGLLRAVLLQIAHPTVAQGVHDFSEFQHAPLKRAFRTFFAVSLIDLGTQRIAVKVAGLVFDKHRGVKGIIPAYRPGMSDTHYSALEPEAIKWVWATSVEGVIYANNLVGNHLSDEELSRCYEQSKMFGRFFGLKPNDMPDTYEEMLAWFDHMVENRLFVTPAGRAVAQALVCPTSGSTAPLAGILRVVTAETLPEKILRDYGWESTPATKRQFEGVRRVAQLYFEHAPAALKSTPVLYSRHLRLAARRLRFLGKAQETIAKVWSVSSDRVLATSP